MFKSQNLDRIEDKNKVFQNEKAKKNNRKEKLQAFQQYSDETEINDEIMKCCQYTKNEDNTCNFYFILIISSK